MNIKSIAQHEVVSATTLNGLPGMSSLELAEITGKQHKNVLRDIQKMLAEIGSNLSQCQFVETRVPDSYGRPQPVTILDKELTFTLLSRYSFTLSNLIVKQWLELEGNGFMRVSVQDAVSHLIEREKDVRRTAFRMMHRGSKRPLTEAQKERRKLARMESAEIQKARKAGREFY